MKGNNSVSYAYLRYFVHNWCKFSSVALVLSNIWHKKCLVLVHVVLENYLNFTPSFLNKHKICIIISFYTIHVIKSVLRYLSILTLSSIHSNKILSSPHFIVIMITWILLLHLFLKISFLLWPLIRRECERYYN